MNAQADQGTIHANCGHVTTLPIMRFTIDDDRAEKPSSASICLGCLKSKYRELVLNAQVLWAWDRQTTTEVIVRYRRAKTKDS